MRTLRVCLAATVILALLGGATSAVLAQNDAEASLVAVVTGTEGWHMTTTGVTTVGEDGVVRYRSHISMCQADTNDPRANEPYKLVWETGR